MRSWLAYNTIKYSTVLILCLFCDDQSHNFIDMFTMETTVLLYLIPGDVRDWTVKQDNVEILFLCGTISCFPQINPVQDYFPLYTYCYATSRFTDIMALLR